jgi:hypothetical protein
MLSADKIVPCPCEIKSPGPIAVPLKSRPGTVFQMRCANRPAKRPAGFPDDKRW